MLLALAVVFAGVAACGHSQGWAMASRNDFHQYPFAPPVELKIGLGWWKATSSVSMAGAPGFEVGFFVPKQEEGTNARGQHPGTYARACTRTLRTRPVLPTATLQMEMDAARGLGACTCAAFVLSVLGAAYLALVHAAEYCATPLVAGVEVDKRRRFLQGVATACVLLSLVVH